MRIAKAIPDLERHTPDLGREGALKRLALLCRKIRLHQTPKVTQYCKPGLQIRIMADMPPIEIIRFFDTARQLLDR